MPSETPALIEKKIRSAKRAVDHQSGGQNELKKVDTNRIRKRKELENMGGGAQDRRIPGRTKETGSNASLQMIGFRKEEKKTKRRKDHRFLGKRMWGDEGKSMGGGGFRGPGSDAAPYLEALSRRMLIRWGVSSWQQRGEGVRIKLRAKFHHPRTRSTT